MPPQAQTYTVKGGDNLFSIAGNIYGNQRMFAEIMRLNGLTSGVIRPGMVLRLPQNKPDFAINISDGLMQGIRSENDYVQKFGKTPSAAELAAYQSQQNIFSPIGGLSGIPEGMTQEQYLSRFRTASGTGTGMTFSTPTQITQTTPYPSPYTSSYQPGYNVEMRGRGYAPITRLEYNKNLGGYQRTFGVTGTPGNPQISEYVGNLLQATAMGGTSGGVAGAIIGSIAAGVGALPGAAGGSVIGGLGGAANYIYKQSIKPQWENYQQQAVDPVTGQPIYTQPLPKPPQAPTTGAVYGPATAQPIVTPKTYNPLQKTVFDTQTPNIPKTNLQEQQLPDPTVDLQQNSNYLQNFGFTQQQINLWNTVINGTPSQEDINQFRYVFNISPNSKSELNTLLLQSGVPVPPTNDQVTYDIYKSLMELGGGSMPVQIPGPSPISSKNGGGSGSYSTYKYGGTATYGGNP